MAWGDKQIPKQGFLGVSPGSAFLGYFGKLLNLSGLQFFHLEKKIVSRVQSWWEDCMQSVCWLKRRP